MWAAIQRNACEKMSPIEKLECPLLRCRKRFPNHELMLKHLYTCDLLSTGEYWCYECEKPEKFTDGKCKRCLGHPGKRRKILKIAKNFFSTIGHKSRKEGAADLDLVATTDLPPPSYGSLHVRPQQIELSCATEIVEIDSVEISATRAPQNASPLLDPASTNVLPATDHPTQAAALDCMISSIPSPLSDWDFNLLTGAPGTATVENDHSKMSDRPALQLTTYDLAHYRRSRLDLQNKGKKLSPSSSLRSNASFGSHVISPISAFSGAWTVGSGFETDLTSPTSDGGFLSRGGSNASRRSCFDSVQLHETISELPAESPLADTIPPVLPDGSSTDYCSTGTITTVPDTAAVPTVLANSFKSETYIQVPESSKTQPLTNPHALITSAWETLQTHITSSMQKLRHMSHNPLVNRLQFLDCHIVGTTGLATLQAILEGEIPTSPLDWLCFVHFTYSLSLVVYERDAESMAKRLFAQAYLYGSLVAPELRSFYLEVATSIWHPLDMTDDELAGQLLKEDLGALPIADATKGKTCGLPIVTLHGADDLLEIARFFLDELEHAAIPVSGPHPIAAAKSDSWVQQTRDADVGKVSDRGFSVTVGLVVNMLQGQFANAFGLVKKLAKFQKRVDAGEIQNPRRAELELIQAGKGHFSNNVYFDSYVPAVRQHCDNIYEYAIPDTTSRATYHLCGIRIMKDVMSDLHQSATSLDVNGTDKETLDDIFKTLTTGFEDDHLDDMLILDGSDGVVATPDTKISLGDNMSEGLMATYFGGYNSLCPPATSSSGDTQQNVLGTQRPGSTQQDLSNEAGNKVESPDCCDICGFRPKGHPKWFKGTLTKHKKLQHKTTPPTIYRCPFPGCTSQYKNRPDNLRQHQLDKSHFVDGEGVRRPSKRKKVDDSE